MEYLYSPRTKEYSITTAKRWGLLFILTLLFNCNTMKENKFIISGDTELLKNSKICIVKTSETGKKKIGSALYLNEQELIIVNNDIAEYYKIYVSFKDSLVTVLKFENINRNIAKEDITLIMEKDKNGLVGIRNGHSSSIKILIPLEEYLKKENIGDTNKINEEKKYFFFKH